MNENRQRQNLRWNLKVIFLYYSSYGDRNNYKSLKTQNYRRFLIDSESVKSQAEFPPFDIAFKKISPTAINYEQFQQIIPNIAQLIFRNNKRAEAFNNFMKINMHRLYNEILSQSDFGMDVLTIQSSNIEKKSLQILESVSLRKVYEKYVLSTKIHHKNMEQTFQSIHLFLNDFQISPKIICKVTTFLIFFYLFGERKINPIKCDFEDLKKIIIYIAELNWRRNQNVEAKQEEKLVRILHQMELSAGFKKIVDKTLKENGVSVSFFKKITHRLLTEAHMHSKQKIKHSSRERSSSAKMRNKSRPHTTKNNNASLFFSSKKGQSGQNFQAIKEILQLNESQNVKVLKDIFDKLCSYGQVANTKTLKSIKIKKYFQSLNLLAPLSQTWLDIKIVDLCRSSLSGKIQFPHFFQLLVLASVKLKITSDGLLEYIINHFIADSAKTGTNNSLQNSAKLHKHIQQSDNLFYHPYKAFEKLILHFGQGRKQLTYDQLCKLLYDFEVFPSFVSKSKLHTLFQHHSIGNQYKKLVNEKVLNLDGLIQLLNSVSMDIGQNLTTQEKSMFILQKMQDSNGYRTLLGSHGISLIGDLRSRYISIYNSWNSKKLDKNQQKFQQLFKKYENS